MADSHDPADSSTMPRNSVHSMSEGEMMLWSPVQKDAVTRMNHLQWHLEAIMVRRLYRFIKTGHKDISDESVYKALHDQLHDFYLMGNQVIRETATGDDQILNKRRHELFSRVKELEKGLQHWHTVFSTNPANNPVLTDGPVKQALMIRWRFYHDADFKPRFAALKSYMSKTSNLETSMSNGSVRLGQQFTREAEKHAEAEKRFLDEQITKIMIESDKLDWGSAGDQASEENKSQLRVVRKRLVADMECWSKDINQTYQQRHRPS